MRLKLGRPDLAQYGERFDVPHAEGDFAVTFLGVSTLLVDDGRSAVMTDGYFSRPSPRPGRRRTGAARHGRWWLPTLVAGQR